MDLNAFLKETTSTLTVEQDVRLRHRICSTPISCEQHLEDIIEIVSMKSSKVGSNGLGIPNLEADLLKAKFYQAACQEDDYV